MASCAGEPVGGVTTTTCAPSSSASMRKGTVTSPMREWKILSSPWEERGGRSWSIHSLQNRRLRALNVPTTPMRSGSSGYS